MRDANVQESPHSHDEDVRQREVVVDALLFRGADSDIAAWNAHMDYVGDLESRYDALMREHEWAVATLLSNPKHVRKVFERKWHAAHDEVEGLVK